MDDQFKLGLSKAMRYCSKYETCIYKITQKLYDWSIDKNLHNNIIDCLIDEKFINEERYTENFVRDKLNQKWGKNKIKFHLSGYGIDSNLITKELKKIDDSIYYSNIELLIEKKCRSIKDEEKYKVKEKLVRHLVSKGYDFSDVENLIEEYLYTIFN